MSVVASPDSPVLIPIPANFPVTWTDPDDERKFWNHDRSHTPNPLAPLDADLWVLVYGQIDPAGKSYDMPVSIVSKMFNTYMYVSVSPFGPPEQMGEALERCEQRYDVEMGRFDSLWKNEWLPEIQSHLAWWAAFDLSHASLPDLVAHARETWTRVERLFYLHFRVVLPAYVALSQFDELYRDLFGKENAFDSFKLLQGLENKTMESGRALWALSRKAMAIPEVAAVLKGHQTAEIMDVLGQSASGRAFRDEIRDFLQTYGQRGDKWGLSHRSWIEDPVPALKNLKDYASQPALDFDADHAALAAERERAVAAVRDRLKGYPSVVRDRFEFMLKAAQAGCVISEDHGFWIDFSGLYRARCVFMEVGRRLTAAGVLSAPGDVFFLTKAEALRADELVRDAGSLPSRIAQRQAEVLRMGLIDPPPVMGTDYGPPPEDMIGHVLVKFFGGPPPVSDVPGVVKGHAGSPGKVRGRARVIRSLEDAGRLQEGEILVTATTAPPWTPLFATAGGIVTDAGGVLSHCAVVAREYRIPAVVGTGGGTAVIKDGQLIEVDGDAGTVLVVGD
jgi:phosphohistidine swiveling domain-containing protein